MGSASPESAVRILPTLVTLCVSSLIASPGWGADTIEAFEPGVSDFEAGWSGDSSGGALSATVGAGLSRRLSLSASMEQGLAASESTSMGVGAFLGLHERWAGVDLFGELGWDQVAASPTGWMVGLELDDPRHMIMPYLRTAVAGSLAGSVAEGVMELGLATSEPLHGVQPHLELAVAVDWQGYAGIDLGLGPNLSISDSVELIPELRASWAPELEAPALAATVGVIVTRAPESWSERIARRDAERTALAYAD